MDVRFFFRNQGFSVGIRQGIVLNNRRGKFADRRVRQALTLAVDFEWQNRVLHFGYHSAGAQLLARHDTVRDRTAERR